jgi:hypothetical protein
VLVCALSSNANEKISIVASFSCNEQKCDAPCEYVTNNTFLKVEH